MYKLLLCVRYLRTKYIALASIVSVMLGVATMIVVNSVMAGFTTEMRDRIHGFLADVVVEARSMDGIIDAEKQMAIVEQAAGEYIAAMTPTVEVPGMVSYTDPITGQLFTQPIQIVGIDPAGKASVGPLKDYLASHNPEMEEGQIVREAERQPNEAISFNLTPGAQKYRQMVKAEEQLYLHDNTPAFDPLADMIPGGDDQAATPLEAPVFDATAPEATPNATTPDDAALADAPPNPDSVFRPGTADLPAADPTAPLPARVFLGEQITSFQMRDENGNIERVNMVHPGEDIIITTVQNSTPPQPISFSATVVDMFRSGMSEYDSQLVLMNLEQLQKNRGMLVDTNGDGKPEDAITSVQISLKDYADAEIVVNKLRAAFPPGSVTVSTWEAKQGLLLSAVEVETAILNVLLFMIIAVAGFGILAIFFMIVVEKTRDIGILKSLGASSNGVMSIFLSYGLGLGIVGSMAGVTIGLLFVRYINEIENALSYFTGRKVFDEKIYYFPEIPTQVNPMMVFWVASGAIAIAVLASVLPARRASRLHPVRALRFE